MAASVTPIGLDRSFAGSVWQVSPIIDPASRQGEVRISIPYDPSIRPGGFAEARIASGSTTAPLLPQSAVLSDEKGNYVYVVNRENKVERRPIKVGYDRQRGRDRHRGAERPGIGRRCRPVRSSIPGRRSPRVARPRARERRIVMSFRNISSWAIRNPLPPIVLFVALLLAGIVSFMRMDVNDSPDVEFPFVNVSISQPGAAPTELETQVTQKVEAAVRGVTGVEEINSSVREGNSNTFVQFAIGTPVDRATNDVRDAVSQIRGDLPEGILEPQVVRAEGGSQLAIFAVETTDMTLEQLSWYVDNDVSKRLLALPGMASVDRYGGVNREIRVILDPAALQAQGITTAQVNQQLRQINLDSAGGRAEIAGSEQSVRVLGNAATAAELGATQIALPGGRAARLGDIAQVLDGNSEQRSISKLNGRQILSFGISRAKGASDVATYEAAEAELRKIEKDSNGKVKFNRIYTEVDATILQYESSMEMLWEGAVLAVIVVFLFLRDWRATLIAAVAIPLSAIPTFWFLDLMGFTLNFLSLLALSLVAGVLVDDAIVEIENIVRHMRMGKSAYQASIDAADEIGLAVLATTMAIVAVFLPVGLMPGISGQFFKNFGFTVVVAVLISLFVARLITPLMAAYMLRSHGPEPHGENFIMRKYLGALRWTLKHRWSAVVGGIASIAADGFPVQPIVVHLLPAAEPRLQPGALLPAAGLDPRAGRGGVGRSAARRRDRARGPAGRRARQRRQRQPQPHARSRAQADLDRDRAQPQPQAVGDRRCAGQFPVAVGWRTRRRRRRRSRHHAPSWRRRPRAVVRDRQQDRRGDGRARHDPRAARPGRPRAARNHHPPAAGPRHRPWA